MENTGTDEEPPVDSGPLGEELEKTGGVYDTRGGEIVIADVEFNVKVRVRTAVLIDGEVPAADVELAWVTGEPSVDDVDELEYVPKREPLLKLKMKEEVLLDALYGNGWYPPG